MKRVLTSSLLIPAVVYIVLWAPQWLFFGVLAIVALTCYSEFCGIASGYRLGRLGPVGYAAGLVVLAVNQEGALVFTLLALLALSFSLPAGDLTGALPRAAVLLLGIVYIFGAWKCALLLRAQSPYWLLYALVLNWVGDIGAYYVGRKWGRHKLAPVISPGKSWEGAAMSVAASAAFGVVFLLRFTPSIAPLEAVALSVAANAAGQLGDLAESALKRGAGLKDSGALLPGHGGLLDRVDSTLFTLPVVYLLVRHGSPLASRM